MIEIVRLENTKDNHWALMSKVLKRITDFCERHGTDIPAKTITKALASHFISDAPMIATWAILDDMELIGHAVVSVEDQHGTCILSFLQWEMDAHIERDLLRNAFKEVCDFGIKRGATWVQMVTFNEQLQHLFAREWGFKTHRIIMRRSLGGHDNG
jgi:hypothetical protein